MNERESLFSALSRIVADLETNSENGAPDYAHEALRSRAMPLDPGSSEALDAGCRCPVWDNSHGLGILGGMKDRDGETMFVINFACPLHGVEAAKGERRDIAWFRGECPMADNVYPEECCDDPDACRDIAARMKERDEAEAALRAELERRGLDDSCT